MYQQPALPGPCGPHGFLMRVPRKNADSRRWANIVNESGRDRGNVRDIGRTGGVINPVTPPNALDLNPNLH